MPLCDGSHHGEGCFLLSGSAGHSTSLVIGATLGAVGGLVLCLSIRSIGKRMLRQYRAVLAAAAAKKELDQQSMREAIQSLQIVRFPLCVMRLDVFRANGRLMAHEAARDASQLRFFDTFEAAISFAQLSPVLFVSHQWLGYAEPDAANVHFASMVVAAEALCARYGLRDDELHLWVDYHSIPQANLRCRLASISSMAVYASCARYFVVVAPETRHADRPGAQGICDADTHLSRGWCRLEQWAYMSTSGAIDSMFLLEDRAEQRRYGSPSPSPPPSPPSSADSGGATDSSSSLPPSELRLALQEELASAKEELAEASIEVGMMMELEKLTPQRDLLRRLRAGTRAAAALAQGTAGADALAEEDEEAEADASSASPDPSVLQGVVHQLRPAASCRVAPAASDGAGGGLTEVRAGVCNWLEQQEGTDEDDPSGAAHARLSPATAQGAGAGVGVGASGSPSPPASVAAAAHALMPGAPTSSDGGEDGGGGVYDHGGDVDRFTLVELAQKEGWLEASIKVMEGDFTVESDKEVLVDVMLGLFAFALITRMQKRRDRKVSSVGALAGAAMQARRIEALTELLEANRAEVFPPAYFGGREELLARELARVAAGDASSFLSQREFDSVSARGPCACHILGPGALSLAWPCRPDDDPCRPRAL